jgi:DNA polymerase-3 subunit epsilon
VHGLSIEFLSGKPRFEERAEELLAFLEGAMLIMHNASFDVTFLNAELERVAKPRIRFERVVDTLAMARRKHPGSPCSLDALCKRYGIDLAGREKHSALVDCKLLAEVYAELVGGHQARLEFSVNGNGGVSIEAIAVGTRVRPAPLASRLSDEERSAHRHFVASLGGEALWLTLLAEAS